MTAVARDGEGARTNEFTAPPLAAAAMLLPAVGDLLNGATGRCALVCAPAGYGKTTQVSAWATSDDRPVAWIDLEVGDNDPVVLLPLLIDALCSVTDLEPGRLAGARGSTLKQSSVFAPALGRALIRTTQPFVLVLDDVHLIREFGATGLIAALADHVPDRSTVVFVSRGEPALPLARVRADDGLVEVETVDLALDIRSADAALRSLDVILDTDKLAQVVAATEGWAVGVRLAGLAIRDADEPVDSAHEIAQTVRHDRCIADYVHEEWLQGVPQDDVDFLLHVSIFDQLDGPLCDWVLDRADSGERLHRLFRSRVGAMPLRRRSSEYRMHALLREVLDHAFESKDRDARRLLDRRAAEWFERTGQIDAAVRHAFRAGDTELAERLVYDHATGYHTKGRYITVNRWLEMFTHRQKQESPALCLIASMTALGMGNDEVAAAWLRFGTEALSVTPVEDGRPNVAHQLAAFRAMLSIGPMQDAVVDAQRASAALPPGPWRALACGMHGALQFAAGDVEPARARLSEAAAEAQLVGAATIEAVCRAHLALIHAEAGERQEATATARAARSVVSANRLEEMPTMVVVTAMSAFVEALEGNHALARADLQLTRRNLVHFGAVAGWANVQARLALAHASLLLADRDGARVLLDEAEVYLRSQPDATRARAQLVALEQQLRTSRTTLPAGPLSLTPAELKVLHYLPTNLTIAEIAQRLYVSRNTAKAHAAAVYRKLGSPSRGQAVAAARAAGLLAPDLAP